MAAALASKKSSIDAGGDDDTEVEGDDGVVGEEVEEVEEEAAPTAAAVVSPTRQAFLSQITDAVATIFSPRKSAPSAPISQAPMAQVGQVRPEKRRVPARGLPTPVRPHTLTSGGEVAKGGYGEHRLGRRKALPPGATRSGAFLARYLRWCASGLLCALLALGLLYGAQKYKLGWAPNHSLVGAEVCSGRGSCVWTLQSGGLGGGIPIHAFRAVFVFPAIALEFLATKVPLLGQGLVARGSGLLEWSYFMGVILRIIMETH